MEVMNYLCELRDICVYQEHVTGLRSLNCIKYFVKAILIYKLDVVSL